MAIISSFSSACIAISQTSKNISESGNSYYFAVPSKSVSSYSVNGEIILKCPVIPYSKKYTFAKIAVPFSGAGGAYYSERETDSRDFVFVKMNKFAYGDGSPLAVFEIYNSDPQVCASCCEIPVPKDEIKDCLEFGLSFNDSPPAIPLVRKEVNESGTRCAVAILDAVFVDVPLSILMTLTGSVWYYPLTKIK
ncbi:MAG: hypothetical protein K6B46_01580 [Opitutales bacterium]|nr:hypothetical protein [Opitutales bacterium]